jgi:hypothetical protein
MPGITYEEFKQDYLRIIAKIALKALIEGDVLRLGNGTLDLYLENHRDEYQEEIDELNLLKGQTEEAELQEDLDIFNFDFGNDLFAHEDNENILRFFAQDIFDVDKTAPYDGEEETRLDELDGIPENVKDEIKAMAYVAAFQELRKNADDRKGFLHFAGILEKMSDGVKSSIIDNPQISAEVTRVSGILKNVENVGSNLTREKAEALIGENSKSIIFERAERAYDLQQELKKDLAKYLAENNVNIFGHNGLLIESVNLPNFFRRVDAEQLGVEGFLPKQFESAKGKQGLIGVKDFLTVLGIDETNIADFKKDVESEKDRFARELKDRKESLRINKLQSANAKEQLAIKILKVSGVSEGQINRIMQNPNAKFAIVKRAEKAFENLGVNLEEMNIIGVDEALKNIDNKALQGEVEKQSKEFVAQVGRVSSWSIDGQDMRGKENLHEKYQAKANKMDDATFDKNAEKALEYEKTKDERGQGETLAYNLYRKPADLLNKVLTTDDKPFFTPGKTALIGLVALAILAPPAGAIVCACLMCKAAKNQFYDGSKLEEWINQKLYNKPPQKFDLQELEQVTIKGFSQDVKAQYSTVNQEQQRGEELDRRVSKEVAMAADRGQSVQEVRDKVRDIAGAMPEQGVAASAMSLPSDGSARGSYVESTRRRNAASVIGR